MVKIRLTRTGRKNSPSYRIVVTDSRSKRDGKFIEIIGSYNPTENPDNFVIKQDRYDYWTSVGAQTSSAVKKLVNGDYKYEPYDPNAKPEEEDDSSEAVAVKTEKTDAPTESATGVEESDPKGDKKEDDTQEKEKKTESE